MKSKTKVLISFALLIIFLFFSIFNSRISKNIIVNNNYIEFNEKNQIQLKQSGFWNLTGNVIYIDGLATGVGAHNWTWAETQPWCSGSGSWTDPHVIENVTIDGQGSGNCIEIRNSDSYFIIRNCSLYNSSSSSNNAGIKLDSVNNGKIINNNCSDNNYNGIRLDHSDNNTLSGNTANNNFVGIWIDLGYNCTLMGNIMNFCGISLFGSLLELASHSIDYTNLVNNKPVYYYANELGLGSNNFTNAGQIILINCNNSIISGLNLSNGTTGIYFRYCVNNTLSGNIVNNNLNGIVITRSNNNTLSGNTASNNNYHGIALSLSHNNMLSGNTASNNSNGIFLPSSHNNTLSGNTASNNYNGIFLPSSNNNTLSGNTVNNNYFGIYLEYSDNNTLLGNTASNNDYAIYLEYSHHNTHLGNTANNNYVGIYLEYSDNNTLLGNIASDSESSGIYLEYSDNNTLSGNIVSDNEGFGIYLWYSDNNTLSGNNTSNNNWYGLYLGNSNGNTLSGNIISNNNFRGIRLSPNSDNNKFFLNYFFNNEIHAEDNGINNTWDNGAIGNYWDDYDGVDANDDGIGDTPFIISGTAGSQDNFPIWADGDEENPEVPIISFGNYYLLFTFITVLSFIILEKRKKK